MRYLLPLCCLLGLAACRQPEEIPENLLTESQMVGFLKDLHVMEQRVADLRLQSQDSSLAVFSRLEADLYRQHGIDTAAYRRSYSYYAARPERFKAIYQGVVDSLARDDERLKKNTNSRPPTPADTVKRSR